MNFRLPLIGLLLSFCTNAFALPEINTWTTESGLKVLHVESTELPMIDLSLTFDAGSARDQEIAGLSVMMHSLLDKGTGVLNADDVASGFEDVGAQFSSSVDLDRSSISLRSLSDEALFDKALNLYIEVISKPTFPKRDFNREKKRLLIALEDQDQRPSSIVSKVFFKALYQDHPYAQPRDGSKETISKITLKDVKDFHKRYIGTADTVLAIVGNTSIDQAKAIANDISASLPAGENHPAIKKASATKPNNEHINFPSQQAHVRIGQLGIERGNPDYFTLYLGNHVLGGGGFTSRLVEEVRSKRGLSYSVYSYFSPYQNAGPFVLGLQTRSDQADEAIEVCMNVLDEYIENGPTEEELKLSKQNIINGFPLRIDSNRDILGYLSLIGYYGLPITYLNDFTRNIESISLEDVKKAFRNHLNPESFVTVVVGSEQKSEKE